MITVYHLNQSRSQRVIWLLEELGTPYEVIHYTRDPKTLRAPAELRAVHPLGKAPILDDQGRIIAETGVIIEYLVATYGPSLSVATDDPGYWRYRYWMHYAEGSLMPQLLLKLVIDKMSILGLPIRGMVRRELNLHLDVLERELATGSWFVGDRFTAADIVMSYPLEAAVERAGLGQSRPRVWGILQRMHDRPAYKRALLRGAQTAA